MALSDAFAKKQQGQPKAWPLLGPLLDEAVVGYDPGVGKAVFSFYRLADRDRSAELAAASLSFYRLAATAAGLLNKSIPDDVVTITYHFSSFVTYVAEALDNAAEWLACVYEMIFPRGSKPNLASRDFANRFALLDSGTSQTFNDVRPWAEEVYARRRQVHYGNVQTWYIEDGQAVVAELVVRPVEKQQFGAQKHRRVESKEMRLLTESYLNKINELLVSVFAAGAERLSVPRDQQEEIDWD